MAGGEPEITPKAPSTAGTDAPERGSTEHDTSSGGTAGVGNECVTDRPIISGDVPTGEMSELGGINVYITKPPDYPHTSSKLLLLLTGGTGIKSPNNQLQADKYASEGFLVVMPDQFGGDDAPNAISETISSPEPTFLDRFRLGVADTAKSFLIDMWLARTTPEKILPILHKVVEACKTEFPDAISFGGGIYAAGYCIGAKFVLLLAHESQKREDQELEASPEGEGQPAKSGPSIKVGAIAHGAQITTDDVAGVKVPISLVCVEEDPLFPDEVRQAAVTALQTHGIDYEMNVYKEVPHGFAVLGDYQDSKIMDVQKKAFDQMLSWLQSH